MSFVFLKTRLRRDLLSCLLSNPDREYYVRELASLIGTDAGNLSRELRKLEDDGLLASKRRGSLKLFRINKKYPLYAELSRIISKTTGVEGSLRSLMNSLRDIKKAYIYGSFVRGETNASSDIDLFIVGSPPLRELSSKLSPLEKKLSRDINFNVFSKKEFEKEKQKKGSFVWLVEKGAKIVLKDNGDE